MDISVKISAAGGSNSRDLAARCDDVVAAARDLGVDLRPMHPGIDDAELSTYFVADGGSDPETAERTAAQLRALDVVEGAYVSPDPETPLTPDS